MWGGGADVVFPCLISTFGCREGLGVGVNFYGRERWGAINHDLHMKKKAQKCFRPPPPPHGSILKEIYGGDIWQQSPPDTAGDDM